MPINRPKRDTPLDGPPSLTLDDMMVALGYTDDSEFLTEWDSLSIGAKLDLWAMLWTASTDWPQQ